MRWGQRGSEKQSGKRCGQRSVLSIQPHPLNAASTTHSIDAGTSTVGATCGGGGEGEEMKSSAGVANLPQQKKALTPVHNTGVRTHTRQDRRLCGDQCGTRTSATCCDAEERRAAPRAFSARPPAVPEIWPRCRDADAAVTLLPPALSDASAADERVAFTRAALAAVADGVERAIPARVRAGGG